MNKIMFIVEDSVRATLREWKMNCLFVGVLLGTIILMMFCVASIHFLQEDENQMKYDDIENTIETGFVGKMFDEKTINKIITKYPAEKWTISAIKKMNVATLNNSERFVLGIKESYQQYYVLEVKEGVIPDFSKKSKECIIGKQYAKENGLTLGDYISIDEVSFKITGITEQKRYQKYIIVMYDWLFELCAQENVQQTFLVTKKNSNEEVIEECIAQQVLGEIVYSESALARHTQLLNTTQKWIQLRVIAAIIGCLYAFFNILAVCLGKIEDRKKEFLTKQILGLQKSGIFLSFFVENIISFLMAVIISTLAFTPISKIMELDTVLLIDGRMGGVLFVIMIVFACTYSLILMIYLSKCTAMEIIREGE